MLTHPNCMRALMRDLHTKPNNLFVTVIPTNSPPVLRSLNLSNSTSHSRSTWAINLDTSIMSIYLLIIKINTFRGDQTDTSVNFGQKSFTAADLINKGKQPTRYGAGFNIQVNRRLHDSLAILENDLLETSHSLQSCISQELGQAEQCFRFSRNVAQITPKFIYFYK